MTFVPYLFTPPTHGASPSPAIQHNDGYSYLSHTSRAAWKSQKNIVFASQTTTASGIARSTKDQKLSVSYESIKGGPKINEELSEWEVVGQGRYGPLQDWMIETNFGIEDSSGEIRGDWRPSYLILYFPPSSPQGEGYDLLIRPTKASWAPFPSDSFNPEQHQLSTEYVKIMEGKLKEHCQWEGKLDSVHLDEGFEKPVWVDVKPKEQEVWLNPDIYGEKEEKEEGNKCLIQ